MENYKQELDQLKKELNNMIDIAISKIDKPQFKTGKWYCYKHNPIFMGFYKKGYDNFGFNLDGWSNDIVMTIPDLWRLSTESEVKEALTKEAINRGFKGKVRWKLLNDNKMVTRGDECSNFFGYSKDENSLLYGNYKVFCNGIWAELCKPKCIDELISEFEIFYNKNYNNLAAYFKTFMVANKSEIIEALKNLPEMHRVNQLK